jgi:hypothetical protein
MVEGSAPVSSDSPQVPVAPVAPVAPPPVPPAAPRKPWPSWARPLIGISAFVIVLTVAATAAVIVAGSPAKPNYAAGTPEAAFTDFVDAVQHGDWTTADAMVSTTMRDRGENARTLSSGIAYGTWTVTIESVSGAGNYRTLYVSYEMSVSGGMTSYMNSFSGSVQMVLEPSGWKIGSQLLGQAY